MEIRYITFNIDVPAIGAKPDYTPFNGPAFASEGNASPSRNGVKWFDVTDNKYLISGAVGHEFKEGHVYRVTIDFRTKGDYLFTDEDRLSATINGKDAVIEYVNYERFAGISYTFEALKHVHTMTRTNKVPASCTTPGKQTYYYCDSCNKYYEDAAGKVQISNLEAWGNVAALGHTESGLRTNTTHHFKVCTRCYGVIDGSKAEHAGGTATCIAKAQCEACGIEYGTPAEHTLAQNIWGFIDAKGHAHLCLTENCDYRGEVIPHRSSGPATDDKDEICLDCGYVITLSKNHTHTALAGNQSDENSHWQICGCGEIMNQEEHRDANGDGACDVCNATISEKTPNGTEGEKGTDEEEGGSVLIWIILPIALLLGAGGGVAFALWSKKKKKEGASDEENNLPSGDSADL